MILWAIAGVPLGTYNIVEEFNVALRIQPQILTLLSLATWTQCMYYGKVNTFVFICRTFGILPLAQQPTPFYSPDCSRIPLLSSIFIYSYICILALASEEMLHNCFYTLRHIRWHPSLPNICSADRQASRSPMAPHHDGHLKRLSTRCRCA